MQPNNQQQTYQSPQAQQPVSVGMQPQPNMTPGQAPIGSGPDPQQAQNPQDKNYTPPISQVAPREEIQFQEPQEDDDLPF